MGKKKKDKSKKAKLDNLITAPVEGADAVASSAPQELTRKEYEKELERVHVELVQLQEWVKREKKKICIVFEGRDGAGKGGVIKALTERVSPRTFRVVALPAPTDREKSQMYLQRYVPHFPAASEIVIFDRSWYNRAGVERVMGFCTEQDVEGFFIGAPLVEHAMVRLRDHAAQILARGQPRGTDQASRRPHRRWPEALETFGNGPEILCALGRLYARPRRDVREDPYAMGALACREIGRQKARAAQRPHPSAQRHPLRKDAAAEDRIAEAQDRQGSCGRLRANAHP